MEIFKVTGYDENYKLQCDSCNGSKETLLYVEISPSMAERVLSFELCYECSIELNKQLSGKIPEISSLTKSNS